MFVAVPLVEEIRVDAGQGVRGLVGEYEERGEVEQSWWGGWVWVGGRIRVRCERLGSGC